MIALQPLGAIKGREGYMAVSILHRVGLPVPRCCHDRAFLSVLLLTMDYREIYRTRAAEYHRLVSAEDADGALRRAIIGVTPLAGRSVVEVGVGTGRVTEILLGAGVAALEECARVTRAGAFHIIIETLGTGRESPAPPNAGLAGYYEHLEQAHGFRRVELRTDYQFASPKTAAETCRLFFGDAFAQEVLRRGWSRVPECTGLWWRTRPDAP